MGGASTTPKATVPNIVPCKTTPSINDQINVVANTNWCETSKVDKSLMKSPQLDSPLLS